MDSFDLYSYGPTNMLVPEHVIYAENSASYLPIRFDHNGTQYTYLNETLQCRQLDQDNNFSGASNEKTYNSITVNEMVLLSQKVLGLKVNEIAKLVGVSRATLDLHRKGSNAKDMHKYQNFFDFVKNIETIYGDSISLGIRNILLNRKTLLQHLIENGENLASSMDYVHQISTKVKNIKTEKVEFEKSKLYSRTSGIGRLA